ncbi:MAG: hypothetical protein IJX31_00220 [Clostridia bacterium]|nr:hypothetical protein [Clostridia bacterium]
MEKAKRWLPLIAGFLGVLAIVFLALPGLKGYYWNDNSYFHGKAEGYALIFGGEVSYVVDGKTMIAWNYFDFSFINFMGWLFLVMGVLWTFISLKADVKWLKISSIILFLTASFIFCHIRYNIKIKSGIAMFLNGGLGVGMILPAMFSFFAGIAILISIFIHTEEKAN